MLIKNCFSCYQYYKTDTWTITITAEQSFKAKFNIESVVSNDDFNTAEVIAFDDVTVDIKIFELTVEGPEEEVASDAIDFTLTFKVDHYKELKYLEIDHNLGKHGSLPSGIDELPEFKLYPNADNPWSPADMDEQEANERKDRANAQGLEATYNADEKTWTLTFGNPVLGKIRNLTKKYTNNQFEIYYLVRDVNGNQSGSMYDGSYEPTVIEFQTDESIAYVGSLAEFNSALENDSISTIYITKSILDIENPIKIDRKVTINGGNHILSFTSLEEIKSTEDDGLIIYAGAAETVVNDLIVNAGLTEPSDWVGTYAIHVYNSEATLNNVTATGGNGGILVNGSNVILTGNIDVSNNGFGGIEVSVGSGLSEDGLSLDITEATLTNNSETYGLPTIWEDKVSGKVEANDDQFTINDKVVTGQVQYYIEAENAKEPVKATLSMVDPNSKVIGTVGWTRFAGTINVAENVAEGTKAYYIFEITEGGLDEGTSLQYWDWEEYKEENERNPRWKNFADIEIGEKENIKYRFGPEGGFDLNKVDGAKTEFQAKIDSESITGAAYLIDAKTEGIISNIVETTLVAKPVTEQDVAIAAIKPSWALGGIEPVDDNALLPDGVGNVDFKVTIKTSYENKEAAQASGRTVTTLFTIPDGVTVWYPVWENGELTYTFASSGEVALGMVGHPLKEGNIEADGIVYVALGDTTETKFTVTIKLVDADEDWQDVVYGEQELEIEIHVSEYGFKFKDNIEIIAGNLLEESVYESNDGEELDGLKVSDLTPTTVTLKPTDKKELGYKKVRIQELGVTAPEGGNLQVWIYDSEDGKWYDMVQKGWGSQGKGFELGATENKEMTVYIFADTPGTYTVTFEAVDTSVPENEVVIAQGSTTIFAPFHFDAASGIISNYVGDKENITIPAAVNGVTVEAIGEKAFEENKYIRRVTFAEGSELKTIGKQAFDYCTKLESITIPDSVTSIGEGAFRGCEALTSIDIPENVTSLEGYTFYGCTNLNEITIPAGVEEIKEAALSTTALKSITIPDGCTLGNNALSNNYSLTTIIMGSNIKVHDNALSISGGGDRGFKDAYDDKTNGGAGTYVLVNEKWTK